MSKGFKAFIIIGFLLGIGLLIQTISTYIYVADNLVRQEAQRESVRKAQSLERSVRDSRTDDPSRIAAIISEWRKEWQDQVAWIRLVDANGRPRGGSVRESEDGKVLVSQHPFRVAGFRDKPVTVEVAILMDSISASFASLRRNLIVGVSAAIALMASLIIIGLRFPKYVRGKQLEHQLEMAQRVQAALLPKSRSTGTIDFVVESIPAGQVGGDVCDVFEVDHGRTAMVLGDVAGKGMSAALLMGLIHGAVHSSTWTGSTREHEDASERLNDLLRRKTTADRFATLFWGYYEPEGSILRYINAGHLPALLIRRGEGTDLYVQRLEKGGPVLGVVDWGHYEQGEAYVQEGDLLLIFSDGIVEAMNTSDDQFGEQRLIKVIGESWTCSPGVIRDHVLRELGSFTGSGPAQDDQTLVVARFQHVIRDSMFMNNLLEESRSNARN